VDLMAAADGVVYACPVHGFGVSSLMQRFIERAGVGYLRFDRPLTNKVAGIAVTGRRYSHVEVYGQLVQNALLNRMVLIGSGYPAVVHAGGKGEVFADLEGVDAVERMANRMIDLLHLFASHRELTGEALSTPPSTERSL
jgi:multimeric flavodoxin WrbA